MAKTPKNSKGFEEALQPALSGKPLSGSISDWAEKIKEEVKKPAKKPKQPAARSKEPTKSARGTIMGGAASPKERAAGGLNPIPGLDVSLEDAEKLLAHTKENKKKAKAKKDETIAKPFGYDGEALSGVTATVDALSKLISDGNPLIKNGEEWIPHRPARPVKSDGGIPLKMVTDFEPSGDQPTAIKELVEGLGNIDNLPSVAAQNEATSRDVSARKDDEPDGSAEIELQEQTQVLLGVTGSGKTFTMAKVIEETQRPAIILAPNKTLAAQLYGEMKSFFPDNAVEYFVSYYDYYQPEASKKSRA